MNIHKLGIQICELESIDVCFFLDSKQQPFIEIEKTRYTSLYRLVHAIPELLNSNHLHILAQSANFLACGTEFQWIVSLDKLHERNDQDYQTMCKRYDLSEIHPPLIQNGRLVFYVIHDYLSCPYKVSLPFPISEHMNISYELLPISST